MGSWKILLSLTIMEISGLCFSNASGLTLLEIEASRFAILWEVGRDVWNFNCVNFSKLIHTGDRENDDPYIEASQANMVFYVDDETDKEWSVAIHLQPRDVFDMGQVDEEEIFENEPYQQQEFENFFDVDYGNVQISTEEHMSEHT